MITTETEYLGLDELAAAYRQRQLSPVEVTRGALARIERFNGELNIFLTVMGDSAIRQAAAAEAELLAGAWRGPLHGVPVSVKDLFYTKQVRTTGGSRIFEDFHPDFDATVVQRLEAAGAVILGKTNLHELAYGITNENVHFGPCRNPWNPGHMPGGSSGGSAAAVAAGLGSISFGTDTGGSIRIPASWCGVTGLKPTYGRISRHGVMPLSVYLDHVGPFARTVRDAAIAAELIAGYDPMDPSSLRLSQPSWSSELTGPLPSMPLGVVTGSFPGRVSSEVESGMAASVRVFEDAGLEVAEESLPDMQEIGEVAHLVQMADGAAVWRSRFAESPQQFSEDVRLLIEQGHMISAVDYINAQRLRRQFQQRLHSVFDRYAALLLPATPMAAPAIGQTEVEIDGETESVGGAATRFSRPFNLAGVPVLTLPCGFTRAGLPFGMQIVCRAGDERTALQLGHLYQQHTGWHRERPREMETLPGK